MRLNGDYIILYYINYNAWHILSARSGFVN